jgi:hypothetical protein
MSEPEDKPEPPKTESGALRPGPASPSALDSDWDTLLGTPSSSASSRPIFAAPGSKPRVVVAAPEPTPRTSQAGASVSGEFVVIEPRPQPTMPSRPPSRPWPVEHASGGDERDEPTQRLQIVPRTVTLDDEDSDPPAEPVRRFTAKSPAREVEQSRASEPIDARPEPERGGGSRKLVFIGGAIAVVAAIAVLVNNARDDADLDRSASSNVGESSGTDASDPGLAQPEPDPSETTAGSESAGEAETGETGGEVELVKQPRPKHVDPRDPSLIPAGTPDENAKAFLKLPVSIHDGPPLGGIGRSGVHIDEIATARGRDNTDCDAPTRRFSVTADEYVNVCFRAIHPRELESLRVIWEKDGKVTRRGRVRIPDLHAYTTRAYLLLRPEYVGSWRVRIVPEGEEHIDLAVAEFVITQ